MLSNRSRSKIPDQIEERTNLLTPSIEIINIEDDRFANFRHHTPIKERGSSRQSENFIEFRVINKDNLNDSNFVYYDIKQGDTLASLALRYRCSVAKIKELNLLGNDQQFYALNRIKLPKGSLGILEDILAQEQTERSRIDCADSSLRHNTVNDNSTWNSAHSNSVNTGFNPSSTNNKFLYDIQSTVSIEPPTITDKQHVGNIISRGLRDQLSEEHSFDSIFNDLDQQIEMVKLATQNLANGHDIDKSEAVISYRRSQADNEDGIDYRFLLIFVVFACLLLPLGYVVYIEEKRLSNL